ncbi:MAG TPA: PH domain-containing protein [Jatrophihabitans sp.]|nr:PH domain-containing protein [Jatrophihabitans sp.]
MPYPEKILADDEQVVERLHPHWITLVPATLWFIVICGVGGFVLAEVYGNMDSGTGRTILVALIVVVGVLLLIWLSLTPWIRWRTTHYVFTTHRVLIRRGVLRHTGRDISLQRINDVGFTQSLWDRMVGAGSLTIESAGEQGQETLTNIPHSDQMQQQLNQLIEQDGERRARQAYGGAMPQQPYPPQSQYPGYPPQNPYPPTQGYPPQR